MDIKTLAREAGISLHKYSGDHVADDESLTNFARLIAEECAKVCEDRYTEVLATQDGKDDGVDRNIRMMSVLLPDCAQAIRDKFGG